MRTKNFMLTVIAAIAAISVSAQSVEMNSLSNFKSRKGDKLETGYAGTAEFDGFMNFYDGEPTIGLSTTHGYAVSPIFTIGGGLAVHYNCSVGAISLPLFLNMRTFFIRYGKVRPYVDLRAGYRFVVSSPSTWYDNWTCRSGINSDELILHSVNNKGLYLNLSFGIRIVKRIDIGIGVGYIGAKCAETVNATTTNTNRSDGFLGIRLGYKF